MTTVLRTLTGLVLAGGLLLATATIARADHANEAITVTPFSGLGDGQSLQVEVAGFAPDAEPVKLVISGQGELAPDPDLSNSEEYAAAPEVPIGPDGTGSADFVVSSDRGIMQDGSTRDCTVEQCWLIAVQAPFLPQPNYASQELYFGDTPPSTTVAPTPTDDPTTTAAPETTTTVEPTTTSEAGMVIAPAPEVEDDDSNAVLLVAIIVAVVLIGGAATYFLTRKKPTADGIEPADRIDGDIAGSDVPSGPGATTPPTDSTGTT